MWKRSFVATTVALGDSVDDALAAIGGGGLPLHRSDAGRSASHVASAQLAPFAPLVASGQVGASAHVSAAAQVAVPAAPVRDDVAALVAQLRAPQRATRAAALARAVHEIVLRIDEGTLR